MKYQQFTFPTSGNARARHVALFCGVHISTVWRWVKHPDLNFPKPHRLTDGVTVFDAEAVREWNALRTGGEHA